MQPGVVSALVAVPGVRDVLLDLLLIARIDRMHVAEVAIEHHAARILEGLRLAVALGGELAIAEVVR